MSVATSTLADLRARLAVLLGPMVPEHLERLGWDDERLAAHQSERLRALVDHAQLTPEDRRAIEDAFGVPVVDQFAATEGMVGHSEPGERALAFASDSCIIEPVDADNRPVAPGTPSTKVLVTNLHNLTQPMIRLEVSDRFVSANPALGAGFLRATAEGRADDRLRYGQLEIHPIAVGSVLVQAAAISEYQVRQTARGLEAVVTTSGPLDEAALASAIADGLKTAGLAEPEVAVRRVEAIARDPRTGKVRRVVPLGAAPPAREVVG